MANKNVRTNFKDGSNVYFTSDTHFNHKHIIGFCHRPFKSIDDMNGALIRNWNSVVPKDGIVFHLGDFAWGNNWKPILDQLNGTKYLILGNHDFKNIDKEACNKYFEHVSQQMFINIEHRKVYLNHNPFLCYGGTYRSEKDLVYQLFGHVHSGPYNTGLDLDRLKYLFPTQYDVGVDNNDFKPISWYDVDNIIKKQIQESK